MKKVFIFACLNLMTSAFATQDLPNENQPLFIDYQVKSKDPFNGELFAKIRNCLRQIWPILHVQREKLIATDLLDEYSLLCKQVATYHQQINVLDCDDYDKWLRSLGDVERVMMATVIAQYNTRLQQN